MLRSSFGSIDVEPVVAGTVKTDVLMKNVKRPFDTSGGFHIRMVSHSDHEAFRVRMPCCFIGSNPPIEIFLNIIRIVVPMNWHGQCVTDKQAPEDILNAL